MQVLCDGTGLGKTWCCFVLEAELHGIETSIRGGLGHANNDGGDLAEFITVSATILINHCAANVLPNIEEDGEPSGSNQPDYDKWLTVHNFFMECITARQSRFKTDGSDVEETQPLWRILEPITQDSYSSSPNDPITQKCQDWSPP